jgi:hypothetical protein
MKVLEQPFRVTRIVIEPPLGDLGRVFPSNERDDIPSGPARDCLLGGL